MALPLTPALTALIRHAAWWPEHDDEAHEQAPAELASAGARGASPPSAVDVESVIAGQRRRVHLRYAGAGAGLYVESATV